MAPNVLQEEERREDNRYHFSYPHLQHCTSSLFTIISSIQHYRPRLVHLIIHIQQIYSFAFDDMSPFKMRSFHG